MNPYFEAFILLLGVLAVVGWLLSALLSLKHVGAPWYYENRYKARCPYCITAIRRGDKVMDGLLGTGHKRCVLINEY